MLKLASVFQAIRVKSVPGGRITVAGPFPGPIWMVEQSPYVFRETLGDRKLVFREENGRVTHAFFDHTPMVAFERRGSFDTRAAQGAIVMFAVASLGLSILLSVFGLIQRFRRRKTEEGSTALVRASTTTFAVLFAFTIYELAQVLRDQDAIAYGIPAMLRLGLVTPVLAMPFWLLTAGVVAIAWKLRWWSLPVRLHYTFTLAVGAGFIAWLAHWNLLGT